jgi:hypothetical protein
METNTNFGKGSSIGVVRIHMEGLWENKNYFGITDFF